MNLTELFTSIAEAIRNKKETTEKIKASDFPNEILSIEGGLDTSDATATAEDMAQGATAYVNGEKVTGTLPKWYNFSYVPETIAYETEKDTGRDYLTFTRTHSNKYMTHPTIDTTVKFKINVESKLAEAIELTPEKLKQGETILGVEGTLETLDTSDATATAENIIQGQTAYVNGEKITGTMPIKTKLRLPSTNVTEGDTSISAYRTIQTSQAGYYGEASEIELLIGKSKLAETIGLTSEQIAQGETVLGVEGTFAGGGDIAISNAYHLFYDGARLDILNELISTLKNVTNTKYMFYYCSSLKEVPQFDTSNVTDMSYMFFYCSSLATVPQFDASSVKTVASMFTNCTGLVNLGGFKNLGKAYTNKSNNDSAYKLDLSKAKFLTHDSLMNVINNLYDLNLTYDVANGGTLYTQSLVLGATNLAKLTEEEIATCVAKGWSVS